MGADRGIHVEVPLDTMLSVQPIHVSKILAELAKKEVNTIQLYITKYYKDLSRYGRNTRPNLILSLRGNNLGTQITLRGWIFWTIAYYNLKLDLNVSPVLA